MREEGRMKNTVMEEEEVCEEYEICGKTSYEGRQSICVPSISLCMKNEGRKRTDYLYEERRRMTLSDVYVDLCGRRRKKKTGRKAILLIYVCI